MPATASFDVTSPVDFQEVDNALNQARKEVGQRYDFKGAKADIELSTTESDNPAWVSSDGCILYYFAGASLRRAARQQ